MSHEKQALGFETDAVECGQPGFAETGGEDDKAGLIAFVSGPFKGTESLLLDRVWLGRGWQWFGWNF